VTALTGITDQMVAGRRIDEAAVSAFVEDAVIVIPHNAGFDRKFAERYWPVFERRAWGCSEVAWRQHGFEGLRLGYLLNGAGFFHQAHATVDDCHALLEILSHYRGRARQHLPSCWRRLAQARKKTMRIWAEQSPFELKDTLKRRGYRWSDGSDGRPRSWYVMSTRSRSTTRSRFSRPKFICGTFSRDCRR
jgi:DNA polymerase-3 subunit epsilon